MKITYAGHSTVRLQGTKIIFIDPFFAGNPQAPHGPEKVTKADIIVVTHDHGDHIGDALPICKFTGATLVSQFEIAKEAESVGVKAEGMNIGGAIDVQGVKIAFTEALHSSATGHPMGAVVTMDGKTIYHCGDTGLFTDMKLIGELFKPDLAFVPIGGRFTMDIPQAVRAVEFIGAPIVIPIHYNTWPIIVADPHEFAKKVGKKARVVVLKPAESFEL